MLALGRKPGEEVVINAHRAAEIRVKVGRLRSGNVQLLFDAPTDVQILRRELLDRVRELPPVISEEGDQC